MKVIRKWERNSKPFEKGDPEHLSSVLDLSNLPFYTVNEDHGELSERNSKTLALLTEKLVDSGVISFEDAVECFGFDRDYFIREE